jgi:hypothetical protein
MEIVLTVPNLVTLSSTDFVISLDFFTRPNMANENYQWSENDARTNLLHAEAQFARKVKTFWSGFSTLLYETTCSRLRLV